MQVLFTENKGRKNWSLLKLVPLNKGSACYRFHRSYFAMERLLLIVI